MTNTKTQHHMLASTLTGLGLALILSHALWTSAQAQTTEQRISATAHVVDGCGVQMDIEKPPGVYTIVYRKANYPLMQVSPESDIDREGLFLVGGLLLLMAEPEHNRAVLAITRLQADEPVLIPIDYNDQLLSEQLETCLNTTDNAMVPKHNPDSPYAPIPTPAELRQQALELDVPLDDFFACPCGEHYAAVKMDSPPWYYNKLVLDKQAHACSLRSDEPNNPELIGASKLADTQQMDCVAQVGIRTPHHQTNFSPKAKSAYDTQNMQACYNIISAKAKLWFKAGGKIRIIDTQATNSNAATTDSITLDQLSCGAP